MIAELHTEFPGAPARKLLGWRKRCMLAHAFLWDYSYNKAEVGPSSGATWRLSHCRHAQLRRVGRSQKRARRTHLRERESDALVAAGCVIVRVRVRVVADEVDTNADAYCRAPKAAREGAVETVLVRGSAACVDSIRLCEYRRGIGP